MSPDSCRTLLFVTPPEMCFTGMSRWMRWSLTQGGRDSLMPAMSCAATSLDSGVYSPRFHRSYSFVFSTTSVG